MVKLPDPAWALLPRPILGTLVVWSWGLDPRRGISRSTYFRHLAALRALGIDIAVPFQSPARRRA